MTCSSLPSLAARSTDAAGTPILETSRARLLGAACASTAAGLGLLTAGKGTPLLLHVGTAAFLSLIVFEDVRRMRIPNALTFPALLVALVAAAATGGVPALVAAILGALAGLFLLLGPYALGWLGAGDVKAMLVVGALFGARAVPSLFLCMVLAGGSLALAYVILRGELPSLLMRWLLSAFTTLLTRRLYYAPAPRGSAAAAGLPFGIAMACGVIAYSIWENPR
jgi:prepilin peptidase CpaA